MAEEQPTFDQLIEQAGKQPEAERVRKLCALLCNAASTAFWRRGAHDKADGALACARAIRLSEDAKALEATIRRIAGRM